VLLGSSCAPAAPVVPPPVPFESVRIHLVAGADSVPLTVEVAATPAQQERGLMDRPTLDPDGGMLFLFEESRGAGDGFWMWRTPVALDLAVLDAEGRILAILGMEPCLAQDPGECTEYLPGVPHAGALEVNRGWFERNGVGVGSRVVMPGR
jgi:uncharacterized protein